MHSNTQLTDFLYSPPLPSTTNAEVGTAAATASSASSGVIEALAIVGSEAPGRGLGSHLQRLPPCIGNLWLPAGPTSTRVAAAPRMYALWWWLYC